MAKIFNALPDEIVGKSSIDLFPEELARRYQADDQEVVQTQTTKTDRRTLCGNDGKEHWTDVIKTPIINNQGEVVGTAGLGRDITERKSVERLQTSIYRISEAANTASNLDELFRNIHASINDLMPAKNFYIALYVPSTNILHFPYHTDEFDPENEWLPNQREKD